MTVGKDANGLKDLGGALLHGRKSNAEPDQPSTAVGLWLTLLVAGLNLSTTVVTSFASSSAAVPGYTQNFLRCFAAAVTLRIVTLFRGESVMVTKEAVRQCVSFGLADWFFLWGYVKALITITVLQFASVTSSLGPAVAAIMGYLFIDERLSKYKIFVLVRNVVLACLIVNPFGESTASSLGLLVGLSWALVANMGTGAMRIVQRSNKAVPVTVLTFWGYVLNTFLWFPPGCIPPRLRVPFLWPAVVQDQADISALPVFMWIILLLSGILGAGVMVVQGYALKHLDVATYSMLVTPLGLVLSTVYSAIKAPLGGVVCAGVILQVAALLIDAYKGRRESERE